MMNFLKSLFGKKEEPASRRDGPTVKKEQVISNADFWNWFQQHEQTFFKVVKERVNIERDFFNKLSAKLNELKDGYWYLTGMYDDNTVELILTPDGNIPNIVFIEELVAAAPNIPGWKFTALKPAIEINDVGIEMNGYKFDSGNLRFYPTEHPEFPDEIDIAVVHDSYTEQNKDKIGSGVYIFLDNYLGELNFATMIDNLKIIGRAEAQGELIPIDKLKDYLIWREKEFVEKYEGTRHITDNDKSTLMEAQLQSGKVLVAVMNTDLLEWDCKASHPWILHIEIKYDGSQTNGMPDKTTQALLQEIEEEITKELIDSEGYLNIGRQTGNNMRDIYFACKDFRKPSKVLHWVKIEYAKRVEVSFDIFKDKYWRSLSRFMKG